MTEPTDYREMENRVAQQTGIDQAVRQAHIRVSVDFRGLRHQSEAIVAAEHARHAVVDRHLYQAMTVVRRRIAAQALGIQRRARRVVAEDAPAAADPTALFYQLAAFMERYPALMSVVPEGGGYKADLMPFDGPAPAPAGWGETPEAAIRDMLGRLDTAQVETTSSTDPVQEGP